MKLIVKFGEFVLKSTIYILIAPCPLCLEHLGQFHSVKAQLLSTRMRAAYYYYFPKKPLQLFIVEGRSMFIF